MTLHFRASDIISNADDQPALPLEPCPPGDRYSPRTSVLVILGLSALLWGVIFLGVKALLTLLS